MDFRRNRFLPLTAEEILTRAGNLDIHLSRKGGETIMHFEINSHTLDDLLGDDRDSDGPAGEGRPVEIDADFLRRLIDAFGG